MLYLLQAAILSFAESYYKTIMKQGNILILVFISVTVTFMLQSCCKVYCGFQTFNIRFINYKVADIDTVLFTKYVANGKFDQKLDSVFVYNYYNQADTIYSALTQKVEFDKDWIIKIPNIGKEYRVKEIRTVNRKCTCGNSNYKVIESYQLDGVVNSSDYFDLKK